MENKPKKRKKIEEKSDSENEEDEEIEKYPKKTKKSNKKTQKKTKSKSKSRSKNKEKSKEQKKTKSRSKNKSSEKEKIYQPTLEKYGIKSEKKDSSSKKYPPFPNDKSKKLKIIHWNINGLRPLLKTKELDNLIKTEDPDIICFSETRIDNYRHSTLQKTSLTKPVDNKVSPSINVSCFMWTPCRIPPSLNKRKR